MISILNNLLSPISFSWRLSCTMVRERNTSASNVRSCVYVFWHRPLSELSAMMIKIHESLLLVNLFAKPGLGSIKIPITNNCAARMTVFAASFEFYHLHRMVLLGEAASPIPRASALSISHPIESTAKFVSFRNQHHPTSQSLSIIHSCNNSQVSDLRPYIETVSNFLQ